MRIYIITGISGYLGKLLAKSIEKEADLIIGTCRDIARAKQILESELNMEKIILVECDFAKGNAYEAIRNAYNCAVNELSRNLENNVQNGGTISNANQELYILHCASETASKRMIETPVEVLDGIVNGTKCMLELARDLNAKSFVYLSSMEAYGQVSDIGRRRAEDELGEIDITLPRSCYPMGKKLAEHYCHLYHKQYGIPVKIARLSQTFGIGVNPEDKRVFMQFAKAAIDSQDIVLKTEGKSVGNYVAADDAIDAILLILREGENGECYNVVNEANTMTIMEMAKMVCEKIAGGKISVTVDVEDSSKTGYASDTALKMSGQKLRKLGWTPKKSLDDMYRDVVDLLTSVK